MCARHGRGAIEIYLLEKGATAKKDWETLFYSLLHIFDTDHVGFAVKTFVVAG